MLCGSSWKGMLLDAVEEGSLGAPELVSNRPSCVAEHARVGKEQQASALSETSRNRFV